MVVAAVAGGADALAEWPLNVVLWMRSRILLAGALWLLCAASRLPLELAIPRILWLCEVAAGTLESVTKLRGLSASVGTGNSIGFCGYAMRHVSFGVCGYVARPLSFCGTGNSMDFVAMSRGLSAVVSVAKLLGLSSLQNWQLW